MPARKLNIFQRITLQWDALHAYNAAQVMELDARPPIDFIRAAWHETLDDLGLDSLTTGPSPDVAEVSQDVALDSFLSNEMNRPFDRASANYSPFRPFLRYGGEGVQLGVVYHHWAADSS